MISSAIWQQRNDADVGWNNAQISSGRGLPVVDVKSWGAWPVRLSVPNLSTKLNCREIEGGWQFDLNSNSRVELTRKSSLTFPNKEVWAPENALLVVDFVFDRNPGTNVFAMKLDLAKAVQIERQPPLTQSEIDAGCLRADWVVESYAVYHEDGRKLGHIPRPFAVDADGDWVWGDFLHDPVAGTLAKRIPRGWLDRAKYPVRIDDTFGYTSAGGSDFTVYAGRYHGIEPNTDPASDGTMDSVNFWARYTEDIHFTCGIYDDDSGDPNTLLGATQEIVGSTAGTPLEHICAFSSGPSISASTPYHLGIWRGDAGFTYLRYDAGTDTNHRGNGTYSGGTMPNPFVVAADESAAKYSIWGVYTEGGGETTIQLPLMQITI